MSTGSNDPVSLRDFVLALLTEADRRYEQRFADHALALEKAEHALEGRLANINEFRAQLSDVLAQTVPRRESEARMKALEDKYNALATALGAKYDALASRADLSAGRTTGLNAGWALLVGAVGLLGTVIAIVYAITK